MTRQRARRFGDSFPGGMYNDRQSLSFDWGGEVAVRHRVLWVKMVSALCQGGGEVLSLEGVLSVKKTKRSTDWTVLEKGCFYQGGGN